METLFSTKVNTPQKAMASDLFLTKLPDCIVTAAGKVFPIQTDWRTWLGFSRLLSNKDTTFSDIKHIYTEEIPSEEEHKECFDLLIKFYQPVAELPRATGEGNKEKVLDYFIDSQLIYCAFLEQYGIDLLETTDGIHFKKMHWHVFLALLSGLHNTKLNDVMSWRCWSGDTKTEYGKQMLKLKQAWALPDSQENVEQVQKDLDAFNSLFKGK